MWASMLSVTNINNTHSTQSPHRQTKSLRHSPQILLQHQSSPHSLKAASVILVWARLRLRKLGHSFRTLCTKLLLMLRLCDKSQCSTPPPTRGKMCFTSPLMTRTSRRACKGRTSDYNRCHMAAASPSPPPTLLPMLRPSGS